MPESDLRVIAPDVGGGFGQKMSLPPEFVVVTWLARKRKTSVAWTEDRRENLIAGFHSRDQSISLEGAFDAEARLVALAADVVANVGAYSCYPTTCGSRAADGDGGNAGTLRRARICLRFARRRHQHLSDGAVSRRLPPGDHVHDRAADGQGGRCLRARSGRDPPPQPGQDISLHLGDRPGVRRSNLCRDHGDGGGSHRRAGIPRPPGASAQRKGAISVSASRHFPSAPAMARRPSPPAAWT